MSFPLVMLGILTLAFYFNDILIARKLLSQKLGYLRIPFIIVSLLILGCFFFFSIAFAMNYLMASLVDLATILNIFFISSSGIYLLVCGLKLIQHSRKYKTNNEKTVFEKKLYPLLFFVTFGILIYLVGLSLFLAYHLMGKYDGKIFEATWMSYWVACIIIIGAQVILFGKPAQKPTTSEMKGLLQNSN